MALQISSMQVSYRSEKKIRTHVNPVDRFIPARTVDTIQMDQQMFPEKEKKWCHTQDSIKGPVEHFSNTKLSPETQC